jgi:hypothetical protein
VWYVRTYPGDGDAPSDEEMSAWRKFGRSNSNFISKAFSKLGLVRESVVSTRGSAMSERESAMSRPSAIGHDSATSRPSAMGV